MKVFIQGRVAQDDCRSSLVFLRPFMLRLKYLFFLVFIALSACTEEQQEEEFQPGDCVSGSPGCPCAENQSCFFDAVCDAGLCIFEECELGALGCPCGAIDDCNARLECNGNQLCSPVFGRQGGVCYPNGLCDPGFSCGAGGLCLACAPGLRGCACGAGNVCQGNLVCNGGMCGDRVGALDDLRNHSCYTPCEADVVDADGNRRPCPGDGLMRGCLAGRECILGSCVAPNEEVPTCRSDVECPDFQVCIEQHCFSNCEFVGDCQGGQQCHRHACRTPCRAGENDCPDQTFCDLGPGDQGVCMPLVLPDPGQQEPIRREGHYEIVPNEPLVFSNINSVKEFRILNHSQHILRFRIQKFEHTADGRVVRLADRPLSWLMMGEPNEVERNDAFSLSVPPQREVEVEGEVRLEPGEKTIRLEVPQFDNPPNEGEEPTVANWIVPAQWDGQLQVAQGEFGNQLVQLRYNSGTSGRWVGTAYYFGQFGDKNLEQWIENRESEDALNAVGNAFVRKWGSFRNERIGTLEFEAMLDATTSGQWDYPNVHDVCPTAACYLFSDSDGIQGYSDDLNTQPVPTGVINLPVALDLKLVDNDPNRPNTLTGRIVTSQSLHYGGDPKIDISFLTNPDGSDCPINNPRPCFTLADSLDSTIVVGGRYRTTERDTRCEAIAEQAGGVADFAQQKLPWIVPGFTEETTRDPDTGLRYRYECRDVTQPFDEAAPMDEDGQSNYQKNPSLTMANPIPDARSRIRKMSLVDAAIVDGEKLYILFKEHFESFLGPDDEEGFDSYGIMVLNRARATLPQNAFEGNEQSDEREREIDLTEQLGCDPDFLSQIPEFEGEVTEDNAGWLATTLIEGNMPDANEEMLYASDEVFYLCHDRVPFFVGNGIVSPGPCFFEKSVTFFATRHADADFRRNLNGIECAQQDCYQILREWSEAPELGIKVHPRSRCQEPENLPPEEQVGGPVAVLCEGTSADRRAEKLFIEDDPEVPPPFVPLLGEIDQAFRYKTRFRNREGTNIGFAPRVCVPFSDSAPYCYDPSSIEHIQKRVNCITDLYSNYYDHFDEVERNLIKTFLLGSFSYEQEIVDDLERPLIEDGFEFLNAELLVMQGDESFTEALRARFDIAESTITSFEGTLFEHQGVNLSGVAGYELYRLYQATQYYSLALDRFYSLSPYMWQSIQGPAPRNFIQQETVTRYFGRVLNASTHLSRTWSEIAKRYQNFNKSELAKNVIERAYTSTYLESVVFSRMMQGVLDELSDENKSQIEYLINQAALRYSASLLEMREMYAEILLERNYFGYSPDYIPFPAPHPASQQDAFEFLIDRTKESVRWAASKEDLAIANYRTFETDFQVFQAELVRIRNTYENDLGDICGTFVGEDGQVHPAVRKYANLSEKTRFLGDPCGLVGNGLIWNAIVNLEIERVNQRQISVRHENLMDTIYDIEDKAQRSCERGAEFAKVQYRLAEQRSNLQNDINQAEFAIREFERQMDEASTTANLIKCVTGVANSCLQAIGAASFFNAVSKAIHVGIGFLSQDIIQKQRQIDSIHQQRIVVDEQYRCAEIREDSRYDVKELVRQFRELELDALRARYNMRKALSDIVQLRNKATRIQAEEKEVEQLTINIESAKNDPNQRIYKNDAIINADRSFDAALRNAYKATKVLEYFTSQTYAKSDTLYLVRMISRGDYNLENYVSELEDSYYDFIEFQGRPELRVDVLSLMNDIMQVPRLAEDGRSLRAEERIDRFKTKLSDPRSEDARGYINIPFITDFSRLSPFTYNHKISHIEVEIVGLGLGDEAGRVYLTQAGTSGVRTFDGSFKYYSFPQMTAVINTFFDGHRDFERELYQNTRLKDRPLINSGWEFVFNQRDEHVNKDISFDNLNDFKIYLFYTDFTPLD